MISVEHMQELIDKFDSGELDIRDIIEQSYFGGRADAIDELLSKCEQYNYTLNSREFAKLIREQLKENKNDQ